MHAGAVGVALLTSLLVAGAARSELYRCVGPDGSVSFTDAAGACGSSSVYTPAGAIQRVPEASPREASRESHSEAAPRAAAAAEAERWREKRRQSQRERAALVQERERLGTYALWCYRGVKLYRKGDAQPACGQVHRDIDALGERIAALDAYLEEGLAEECRQAGCLPGWVR